jgi:hypothetical protein
MGSNEVIVIRRHAMRGFSQMSDGNGLITKPNGKPLLFSVHADAARWCMDRGLRFVHAEAGQSRSSALRNTING